MVGYFIAFMSGMILATGLILASFFIIKVLNKDGPGPILSNKESARGPAFLKRPGKLTPKAQTDLMAWEKEKNMEAENRG